MYKASINEQQLSGSIQMVLIKSIIFLSFFVVFVGRVWQQQCLNTSISICKHGHKHTGEMKRKKSEWQREKKTSSDFMLLWSQLVWKCEQIQPLKLESYLLRLLLPIPPDHCPSSCETTWVMLSLMKADLVNPICGFNRFHQLEMLQRCTSPQTRVVFATHPCNNCEALWT